jgi:hypothetical protein
MMKFRVVCGDTKHAIVLDDAGCVVFVDHPDAHSQAYAETAFAILAGNDDSDLDGCLRVARRIQAKNYSGLAATGDERQLYAALRGIQIGRRLRRK